MLAQPPIPADRSYVTPTLSRLFLRMWSPDDGAGLFLASDGRRVPGERVLEAVGPTYAQAATPVIEEQLAKAGTRLAMLLNGVWP